MQTFHEAARMRPHSLDCLAIFWCCDADLNCIGVVEPLSTEATHSLRVLSNHLKERPFATAVDDAPNFSTSRVRMDTSASACRGSSQRKVQRLDLRGGTPPTLWPKRCLRLVCGSNVF